MLGGRVVRRDRVVELDGRRYAADYRALVVGRASDIVSVPA